MFTNNLAVLLFLLLTTPSLPTPFPHLPSTLIQRHGIPFNAPSLNSNLFQFLTARQTLVQRIKNKHEQALPALTQANSLPSTFECIENTTSIGNMFLQSPAALEHAAQQLEYLISIDKLPNDFLVIAQAYRTTYLDYMATSNPTNNPNGALFVPSESQLQQQFYLHNTLLYYPQQNIQHYLNQNMSVLNEKPVSFWKNMEQKYLQGEVVVVDDLLSKWSLDLVYNFCLEATIFWEHKLGGKYLGAYTYFGLYNEMMQTITKELRKVLPNVIGDQLLRNFWSYKYLGGSDDDEDTEESHSEDIQSGVPPHADLASVNLNLWITPDSANLNPNIGGLDVWKYHVNSALEFNEFQKLKYGEAHRVLEESEKISIPYKRNRMVLFKSDLVHATGKLKFKKGYKNRRINLTWLFGSPDFKTSLTTMDTAEERNLVFLSRRYKLPYVLKI